MTSEIDNLINGMNNISLENNGEIERKKVIQAGRDRLARMKTTGYSKTRVGTTGSLFNPKPLR